MELSKQAKQARPCWFPEYEPIGLRPIGWGDLERIPKEFWAHDGEERVDTGIPVKPEGEEFVPLEEFCEEECLGGDERYEHVDGTSDEEMREAHRSQRNIQLEAGMRLMDMLFFPETAEMCIIVGLYVRFRLDGVVRHFFKNLANAAIVEATLYFAERIREYQPEIPQVTCQEINWKMRCECSDVGITRLEKYAGLISPEAMVAIYKKVAAITEPGPVTKLAKVLWG